MHTLQHPRAHQTGFTLVELMVGLALALITTVIVAQVMWAAEGNRRTTTQGSDAQVNGALALYTLQRDLQMAQEKAAQTLCETKEQAAEILDKANKTANAIVEEAKQQARGEGERLLASAKAEIEVEVNRAKDQLRAQVAALAVAGAEKILESSVDAKAHNDLVAKLASQL